MILASVPSAFLGGIIGTLLAVYAYCSATSDPKTRMIRFALLEVAFWIRKYNFYAKAKNVI